MVHPILALRVALRHVAWASPTTESSRSSMAGDAHPKTSRRVVEIAVGLIMALFMSGPLTHGAKFFGLGDLAGGPTNSLAFDISANGSVVVGQSASASGNEAFRWTSAGGIFGLGDLAGGSFESGAAGISADGSVIVGTGNSTSGQEAFRWTSASGMVGLGDFASGLFFSSANGVSADGSVIVGTGFTAAGNEAFRWTSGSGMVGLGDLPGGVAVSFANATSADGSVIVGRSMSASGQEAFRWTSSGGMVGLGDLPGGSFSSTAYGVSNDGSVVVGTGNDETFGPVHQPFRWTSASGMVGLGGASSQSGGNDVSADGSVVVGSGVTPVLHGAIVWDAINGMRSLREVLLPSVGAAVSGWILSDAKGISADGRTVVGIGGNPSGNQEAWLAYLPDEIFWFPEQSGEWDSPSSWSGPFMPGPGDPVVIAPKSGATVTASVQNRTVKSLVIGSTMGGVAVLDISNGGDLTSLQPITINARGRINIGTGRVLAAPAVTNSGVISGDGQIAADVINTATGEVRVGEGQRLRIGGFASHFNQGKVEVLGGEVEFGALLNNFASSGLITGQDATWRFVGGLVNDGSLALSFGVNNVFGDINNHATGKIVVAGGAHATFYDDVTQNGTLQAIKVGTTNSVAVFAGAFTGSGGSSGGGDIFFLGDLRPGNSPAMVNFDNNIGFGATTTLAIELGGITPGSQFDMLEIGGAAALNGALDVTLINGFTPMPGNSFEILHADDGIFGVFSDVTLPTLAAGLAWDVVYTNFSVLLQVSSGLPGDYNHDGRVDAADYVVWRKNDGSQAGYDTWRTNFGRTAGSGTVLATEVVPEPSGRLFWFLWAGMVTCCHRATMMKRSSRW